MTETASAAAAQQPNRLPAGGRIDRARPISFSFNRTRLSGYQGDTLASALLANGIRTVARSIKYHRPRGILTAGVEEPNAVVQLGTGEQIEPNAVATRIQLFDDLVAQSVNAWPSVEHDVASPLGLLSRFLPAGFYYKTFMRPHGFWERYYEPLIRRAAGLGRGPAAPDPDKYDQRYVNCDVLVVGGGPAGLSAALAAGKTGARIILLDQDYEFGGSLLTTPRETVDGHKSDEWISGALDQLRCMDEVRLLVRTTAFGYYDHNLVCAVERRTDHLPAGARPGVRQRLWRIRAGQVVLATGAHERPLVFPNNDRPGVMLASAVRAYIERYAVLPGRRTAIFTSNDSAYATAFSLIEAGADVASIVDIRLQPSEAVLSAARAHGIELLTGHLVTNVMGNKGVRAIEAQARSASGTSTNGPKRFIDCDILAVCGGWSPAVHLFSQAQGRLRFDDVRQAFVPDASAQDMFCAGALTGEDQLDACIRQGNYTGAVAARAAGFGSGDPQLETAGKPQGNRQPALWQVSSTPRLERKSFVDYQNDTTLADIRLAAREGFRSVEHMKRYTLAGFGTDQGKTGNVNALGILSEETNEPIGALGTTTFRPPFTAITFGSLAGRNRGELYDPVRTTAMHDWHVARGAAFENVGQWKRPWYYPHAGERMDDAVRRECLAVRNAVGVLDASTLGKIVIQGPDAAEFLNRIYTNSWTNLGLGRIRYGLLCREDGMVFDDGTTTRLGQERFFMTTTTGNAATVLSWLEEWLQTEWQELKVYCTSVTDHWATIAIAGPKAREVVAKLAPDIDLRTERFPFMTTQAANVAGVDARVFRISFTGELSYEINVPWSCGLHVWEATMDAGMAFGVTPYGTETMHVLRAEKGFPIVGQDTDGTVTPHDLGMSWAVSKKKDFLGRRSFDRSDTARPNRKQLIGLLTEEPKVVLAEGASLVAESDVGQVGRPNTSIPIQGHVTSSYFSAAFGHSIALALVTAGFTRMGENLYAVSEGNNVKVRITSPVFYDPDGNRRNG